MEWLAALEIPLVRQALLGMLLAGGSISLLGVVIIPLHLTGLRFTLMHVGLLGAALSLSLDLPPITGAFILIMVVSVIMGMMSEQTRLSANALSGFFMTGSLALAFMILARAGVRAQDVFAIFAGSILILRPIDLFLVILLGSIIIAVFVLAFREIQLVLLDRELAAALGVPVDAIRILLFVLLGAGVSLALRLVGALLVDAVILLPALAAFSLANGLKSALLLTSLFGILAAGAGFFLALGFDLPIGASVALCGTILAVSTHFYSRRYHA